MSEKLDTQVDPSEYDFKVAATGEKLKAKLDNKETILKENEDLVQDFIAESAIEGANHAIINSEGKPTGFTPADLGEARQEYIKRVARQEVDQAFDAAKKHYNKNQDQYVANAWIERQALENNMEDKGEQKAA